MIKQVYRSSLLTILEQGDCKGVLCNHCPLNNEELYILEDGCDMGSIAKNYLKLFIEKGYITEEEAFLYKV